MHVVIRRTLHTLAVLLAFLLSGDHLQQARNHLSLCTIMSLRKLHGVWHIQGGSGGGMYMAHKSRNSIAVVWVMRVGGVIEG